MKPYKRVVWRGLPLHMVWSALYRQSYTGLPKPGATNKNAPHVINKCSCLLGHRNDSNCYTIIKKGT